MLLCYLYVLFFFFSSRRRHTRFDCDWSSDVCSSDLRDEVGDLLRSMSAMRESLANIVGDVRRGVESVTTASSQIAAGNQDLSSRTRSEEHTSELQSQSNLVCRLLLEKKKKTSDRTSLNIGQ